jgi:hypothetical protein
MFVTADTDTYNIIISLGINIVVFSTIIMNDHENEGGSNFFLYFLCVSIRLFLMLFTLKCMDYEDVEHGNHTFKDLFFD